jgi:glycerate 2-kinase
MTLKQKTILIAPNSFKECADSVEIANLIEQNLTELSNYKLIKRPISDGGDGFLEVCKNNYGLEILGYEISTPFDNSKFLCEVGYDKKNRRVYIESANVLGLKVIPKDKRRPVNLSSKGLGDLLLILNNEVSKGKILLDEVVIGVGGTGINDLGLGMCSRFGLKIINNMNHELEIIPNNFSSVEKLLWNKTMFPFKIKVITDVDNPLLGENGATKVFGKQKGLSDKQIITIENGFDKIYNLLVYNKLCDSSKRLSGAGGGLAAGLEIFFNAEIVQSYKFILELVNDDNLYNIDAVITGEGAFDSQSMMKKATGSILEVFNKKSIPIFLCSGTISDETFKNLRENVKAIELIKYFSSKEESMKKYKEGIRSACREIVNILEN